MFRKEPELPNGTPLRRRTYWASVGFRFLLLVEPVTESIFTVDKSETEEQTVQG